MVIQSTRYDPRERLRLVARALQDLHRVLLEYQRREYERSFGRIGSDFYLLQLAADDPAFAWLRTLSAEMIRIDVALSGKDAVTDVDLRLVGTRVRHLILPSESPNSFQGHYDRAMQTMPEVVMAHAGVMRSLPPANEVRLFRSEPATDIRIDDASPGIETTFHRPGELVPGHGDHGYVALAAIAEVAVPPGSGLPSRRHANEEIITWIPEGSMRFVHGEGASHVADRDHLLVVNSGTGVQVTGEALVDDLPLRMLQVYVRPAQLQLEPNVQHGSLPESSTGMWSELVGPEDSEAPFHVRNRIEMLENSFKEGDAAELPARDGWNTALFVFDGEVDVDGVPFGPSQTGVVLSPGPVTMRARADSRVLAFLIDPAAKVTRAGATAR